MINQNTKLPPKADQPQAGKIIFYLLAVLFFLFLANDQAHAATITAASCSAADVQAAINQAQDGDTVVVPAGTCSWVAKDTGKASISFSNKAITIQGAGIDQTIINFTGGDGWYYSPEVAINAQGIEGKPFRITGLTFQGTASAYGTIRIFGTCKNWRIDHIKFDELVRRSIEIGGNTYGVIDHCIFNESGSSASATSVTIGNQNSEWQTPTTLGSANAVYYRRLHF